MSVRSNIAVGGQQQDIDDQQHLYAEHSLSPIRNNNLVIQRRMVSRPVIGQHLPPHQRFNANSRLVSGGGNYTVKRSFNEYGNVDYGFRIKFPRNADKSRGLRHFSNKVCEKVKEKGQTNYNEVADELVAEYFDSLPDPPASMEKQQYDTKNIRRRVYDALNVLMAMNIIEKEKKEIHWVGLPTSSFAECRRLEEEKAQRQNRLRQKTEQLQELIIQLVAYKSLVQRNRERERTLGRPADAAILYLPYIIVNTEKKTMVDCAISCDKTEYWFNFDRPFEIHDDIEVLKRLGLAFNLDTGMVEPDDVSHIKSCLPPALRDYIDQIIEGTLSGGVINKSGKGSQTVVISANQQDRKPNLKYMSGAGGGGDMAIAPRSSLGSNMPMGPRNPPYNPPPNDRLPIKSAPLPANAPVARYAVIPRPISTANTRYSMPHGNYTDRYNVSNGSRQMVTPINNSSQQIRHSYGNVSQHSYNNNRMQGVGNYASQPRAYNTYQDHRQIPPQQMYSHQKMPQDSLEEYYEEDVYQEEAHEY